jgi:hypothetical protein
METSVQVLAVVNFLVLGLSHLIQPRAWVDFFVRLRKRGNAGVFVNGFLSLAFGSIVVAFHNVWSGLPMLLTLYGWALVLKALISFTMPGLALRSLQRVSHERSWRFVVPGVMFLSLGGLLAYSLVAGGRP